MRRFASLVLILSLTGCAPSAVTSATVDSPPASRSPQTASPASMPTPAASLDRVAGWLSDLDGLVPAMDAIHPDLFHDTPRADFDALIDGLTKGADTETDDELLVGAMRAVALVSAKGRDGHTGLYPWNPDSRYPTHSLPLRLWVFPDGVHVVDALPPYEDLVGVRVEAIAGHPIDEVVGALDPLIPRDNEATVRLLTPRYLLMPEVLHGLGLVDAVDDPVDLDIVEKAGAHRTVPVTPIPMTDYNAWAGPYGLFLPADPDVPYLARMDEPLWWTRLDDGDTLFVQYNRVEFLERHLPADLLAEASSPDVKRVVVDIRHNFGGEVRALDPVVQALDTPAVDRPGRLFLITGRNTFSAASLFAAELQAKTAVTVVGEPMGGSPNAWGNPQDISLPWSGLSIGVSTLFELATTEDDRRLTIEPDLPVPLTFDDWTAGRDAALEAIRASH